MTSVTVLVRARPLNSGEISSEAKIILKMDKYKTYISALDSKEEDKLKLKRRSKSEQQFFFERSYWSVNRNDENFADQKLIYDEYGSKIVESALSGYNACLFAYGQTGSGKTYTMMGNVNNKGIIPRICDDLFTNLNEAIFEKATFRVEISYMEIYNEQVRDLLERKNKKVSMKSLKLREHPRDGPFVQGLTVHPVTDYSSIESLLEEGNNIRATAATNMNSVSSRSHAIFTIKLSQAKLNDNIPSETTSKVNLVDLAGSERAASSGATGLRLKEGANINKSLVTLSLVISALAENSGPFKEFPRRQVFVPYRDSVLTWLLKDSLGGNSRTIMIAAVSPADSSYNETLSTLKYASHARKIINRPVINEDPNVKLIRELRAEISELQNLLSSYRKNNKDNCKEEDVMQARLHENQERVENLTRNWIDKNMEAQRIFQEKSVHLHCQGQQTVLTTAKVHLINMEDDPLNTDIIIYHLNEGETLVGNCDVIESNCINLKCPSIEKNHCSIFVSSNKVSIVPVAFHTYVNDKQITTEHFLRHGDILQIGEIFRFRFSNPSEAEQLRVNRKSGLFSLDVSPLVLDHYRSFSNLEEIDAVCPGNDNTEIKMLSSTKQSYIQNSSFESQQVENNLNNYVILREKSQQQVQNYKHHRFSFPEKSQVNIANLKLSEKCHSTEILSSSPIMDYQNDSKFTIKNSKLNCTSISTLNLNGNYFLESNDSSIPSVRSDVNLRKVKSLPFLDVYEKPSNNLYMNNRENSEAKSEEEKRKLLQDLISKFRKKEIERVESSAENIRRAESNGKLFVQQYGNLEELLTLQKEQLQNAKSELVNFKKKVLEEKYLLRIGAEHEMSNKLLSCITIENDQIRRKKFLLKLEIEDYWKKMDLYQDLLIEVELDQYSLFRETEGMIAKKCRKYSEERHQQAEELRKNVSNSESRIADLKKDLDDQHLNEQDLTLKLEEIKTKYQTKIFESDEYFWKLRCSQEKELENLKNDLYVLNDRIEYFEKLGVDVCSNKTHVPINSKQISVNMSASDYSELLHTNNIEELKNIRNVVQMHIDETNQKIQNLIQDCRYTSLQLQDEMQSKIARYETSLSKKQEQILKLQRQLSNEQLNCQNFHNNLHLFQHKSLIDQTLETYGSNISCLSESQEQLKDSNAQVKESLEKRLRDEFSTLEELIISSTHKSNQKGIFDKTLQLIFQSGNPFTYTEIISKKHLLYENTKHLLLVTCEDLHLLTQEHLKLHHEFTKDFFLRKSSLEDIQNNEREEIRDFIKWLALDENDAYIHAYKSEENQIMKFQSTLNRLETEMYEKMVEKQNSYLKIEALEEHIRQVNFSSLPFCSQVFVETVDEDLERARLDMSECEFLIQKLQVEIMQEQKSYLAMLRKKEDEMKTIEIGNRLRRCQLFQNQANQAAADVLREVHLCSTIIDCVEKNGENYHSVGGWKYKGKHNGTTLLRKNGDKPGYLCAMVCSLIKVQPRLVWEAIRNPLFRLVYDDMVKKINIVEHCNEHLKIIYLRQKLTFLFISQTLLDCCCVHTERVERNQYVAASVSVDHPDCPITKNVHRLNVGPSGWVVKLFIDENGEEWSMVWYLVNVRKVFKIGVCTSNADLHADTNVDINLITRLLFHFPFLYKFHL